MPAKIRSNQDGAALIEAALILPVLLVVVFGMADLALFLWQLNSAGKAVQLGARKAVVSEPVARGAGLTQGESAGYWNGMTLGESCAPRPDGSSACPVFRVTCSIKLRCVCETGRCDFALAEERFAPIESAMRAVLPQLRADQIELTYATNHLGYVGRPIPVAVDVTVRITEMRYELLFLGGLIGRFLPIRAAVTLPGENMRSIDGG